MGDKLIAFASFLILDCCIFAQASYPQDLAEPPYESESQYTENGKKIDQVTFSMEEPKQCSGNACSQSGSGEGSAGAAGGGGGEAGVEPDPTGNILGTALSGVTDYINEQLSSVFGGGPNSQDAAHAQAQAEIAAYNDYIANRMASTEATVKQKIADYWKGGHFYSESQYKTEEEGLSSILAKMNDGTFDVNDISSVVVHAPATDQQVNKALATQLAGLISRYQRMAEVCGPEGFCDKEFYFTAGSYIAQYASVAKANEEPNFERYCAMVESKVDEISETVLADYDQTLRASDSGEGDVSIKGGLLGELAKLKSELSNSKPHNESGIRAKKIGLEATRIGRGAAKSGDIDGAKTTVQIAKAMLDIAIGVNPVTGFARDVYEVTTGKDLLTGESLTDEQRLLAAIGVISLGVSEQPRTAARVLDELAEREAQVLEKGISKVRAYNSDTVNEMLSQRYGLKEPPYRPGTKVYRYESVGEEKFARFYTEGKTSREGPWMLRSSDVRDLKGNEIAGKFGLPEVPTHVTEVTVPRGTVIERGAANKAIFEGYPDVIYQYRLPDYSKANFGEGLPLPE